LGNTNQIAAEFLKAIILFIIGSLSFAFNIQAQQVLDNGKLRMGTGLEPSINNTGNLQQPFYFNGEQNAWRALTYSTYPLDNAFGVGGDKTHEWNVNGTIVASPLMSNQVIDASGFVITSGQKDMEPLLRRVILQLAANTSKLKTPISFLRTAHI